MIESDHPDHGKGMRGLAVAGLIGLALAVLVGVVYFVTRIPGF